MQKVKKLETYYAIIFLCLCQRSITGIPPAIYCVMENLHVIEGTNSFLGANFKMLDRENAKREEVKGKKRGFALCANAFFLKIKLI